MSDDETYGILIAMEAQNRTDAAMKAVSDNLVKLNSTLSDTNKTFKDIGAASEQNFRHVRDSAQQHLGEGGVQGIFQKLTNQVQEYGTELLGLAAIEETVRRSFTEFAQTERGMEQIGISTGATREQLEGLKNEFEELAATSGKGVNELIQQFQKFTATTDMSEEQAKDLFKTVVDAATATGTSIDDMSRAAGAAINNLGVEAKDVSKVLDAWATEVPSALMGAFAQAAPRLTTALANLGFTGTKAAVDMAAEFVQLERAFGSSRIALMGMQGLLDKMANPGSPIGRIMLPLVDQSKSSVQWMEQAYQTMAKFGAFSGNTARRNIIAQHFGLNPQDLRTLTIVHEHLADIQKIIAKTGDSEGAVRKIMEQFGGDSVSALNQLAASWEKMEESFGGMLAAMGANTVLKNVADLFSSIAASIKIIGDGIDVVKSLFPEGDGTAAAGTASKFDWRAVVPLPLRPMVPGGNEDLKNRLEGLEKSLRSGILRNQEHPLTAPSPETNYQFTPMSYIQRENADATKRNTEALLKLTNFIDEGNIRAEHASYTAGGSGSGGSSGGGGGPYMNDHMASAPTPGDVIGRMQRGGGGLFDPNSANNRGVEAYNRGEAPSASGGTGGGSEANFNSIFKGTPLEGHWQDVVKAANENGVPPDVMAGIMAHETGRGRVTTGNNVAGLMDPKTNMMTKQKFGSIEEGINAAGRIIAKNYNRAGGDIDKMGRIYAPPGAANDPRGLNSGWAAGVRHYMGQMDGGGSSGHAAANGGNDGIPSDILETAKHIALHSGPGGVERFMAENGYPRNGNWCGEFAAAVVRNSGGTPPANPQVASNWRNWGEETDPSHGTVAVRRGTPTGSTGSHVTFVEHYDPKTGTFVGVGGNQGRSESNFRASQYQFYKPHPQQQSLHERNANVFRPGARSTSHSGPMEDHAELLDTHRKMRAEMEKPINLALNAPKAPTYRQRVDRQKAIWSGQDVMGSARYGSPSDIGLA